jgi:hypothetical protein
MLALDNTALSEARLLYPSNDGIFCIGTKVAPTDEKSKVWRQKFMHVSSMEQALAAVKNLPDTYISQATFVTKVRQVSALKEIACCFVDIDCYNLGILPDDDAVAAVLKIADDFGIPRPSYITKSGCGLYAKWLLDRPLGSNHLTTWNQVQDVLISLYKSMGADPKSRDAARVLRATSTVNTKSGEAVEVAYNGGGVLNFTEFAKTLAQIPLITGLALGEKRARKLKIVNPDDIARLEDPSAQDLSHLLVYSDQRYMPLTMQGGIGRKLLNAKSLNWSRFIDIRNLMIMRNGAKRGSRDLFIFWMTTTLASAGVVDPWNFWREVEQLLISFPNSKDFNPLHDGSLSSLKERVDAAFAGKKTTYNGIEYSPIYTPTNDTLLNVFEITPEEERSMCTIISHEEKRRRADLKAPGRSERRDLRSQARDAAQEMRAKGMNANQISLQLNVNRSTVTRWFKAADAMPSVQKESNDWSPERLEVWRTRKKEIQARQAAQLENMLKSAGTLRDSREAQCKLRTAIRVESLIAKATKVASVVCNTSAGTVSSIRKIYTSQASNSDGDAANRTKAA